MFGPMAMLIGLMVVGYARRAAGRNRCAGGNARIIAAAMSSSNPDEFERVVRAWAIRDGSFSAQSLERLDAAAAE